MKYICCYTFIFIIHKNGVQNDRNKPHTHKITTLDPHNPEVQAIAIAESYVRVQMMRLWSSQHLQRRFKWSSRYTGSKWQSSARGGLNYNMELRWEGVPSVHYAYLKSKQIIRQLHNGSRRLDWVPVCWKAVTNFSNKAAPDTPVFVLHLYASGTGQRLMY